MAAPVVTPAEVQAALGTDVGSPKILRAEQITDGATAGAYLVDGQVVVAGRVRWVAVTNTDSAATQAAAILTGLRA
jgi:hypothetical protein